MTASNENMNHQIDGESTERSKEKKKTPLWQTLLLVGAMAGYGGYEIYNHDDVNEMNERVHEESFVTPFPIGSSVVVYSFKSDKKTFVTNKTVLADIVQFYTAEVVKEMSSTTDTLNLKVISISEGNDSFVGAVGEIVENVDQSIVYPTKFETPEIQKLYSKLQFSVFQIVNKDVSVRLSNLSDLHINLADSSMSIDREIDKYLRGDHLDSDMQTMFKFKKLLAKSNKYLNEIYDLNKHYKDNFGVSVVDLERICDIELFFKLKRFQNGLAPQIRLLNYFSFLESSGNEMKSLMTHDSQINVMFGMDDLFELYEDESMNQQFHEYENLKFLTLHTIAKRNLAIEQIQDMNKKINDVMGKLDKIKSARKIIDNFATYLVYFHPKVSASASLSDMLNKSNASDDINNDLDNERSIFEINDDGDIVEIKDVQKEQEFLKNMNSNYDLGIPEEELVVYKSQQEEKMKTIEKEEKDFEMILDDLKSKRLSVLKNTVEECGRVLNPKILAQGLYQLDYALALYYEGKDNDAHKIMREISLDHFEPVTAGHPVFDYLKKHEHSDTLYYYYRLALSHLDGQIENISIDYSWKDLSNISSQALSTEITSINRENFKSFVHLFYKNVLVHSAHAHKLSLDEALKICKDQNVVLVMYDHDSGLPYEDSSEFLKYENGVLKLITGPYSFQNGLDLFKLESQSKNELMNWLNVLTKPKQNIKAKS
jgi:hypothetical protein